MILYQMKVNLRTTANWSDDRTDSVIEAIESELENLKDLIEQKLSKIPEANDITVEVTT